jgi:hypothetical protein
VLEVILGGRNSPAGLDGPAEKCAAAYAVAFDESAEAIVCFRVSGEISASYDAALVGSLPFR